MFLRKLWRWERIGILEYHRNLRCIFHFSVDIPAALKCYESYWKMTKVFLNVQNIMIDNFNLVKSLRKTCKWVYFFAKKWMLSKLFFKILLTISQRYCLLLTTLFLKDTVIISFSISSTVHLTRLSTLFIKN